MSYVYFIRVGEYVKVGFSYRPESRVRNLNYNLIITPDDFDATLPRELIHSIGECTAKDEKRVHEIFAEHRVAGEWFRAAPVVEALASLQYTTLADERREARRRRAEEKRQRAA